MTEYIMQFSSQVNILADNVIATLLGIVGGLLLIYGIVYAWCYVEMMFTGIMDDPSDRFRSILGFKTTDEIEYEHEAREQFDLDEWGQEHFQDSDEMHDWIDKQ